MNATILLATLRRRVTSLPRWLLVIALGVYPLIDVMASRGSELPGWGFSLTLAMVVGAGTVGEDIASGALQLILVRPITRPAYVASSWLAVSIAGATLTVGQVLCARVGMAATGAEGAPALATTLVHALDAAGVAVGAGAVLTFLGTLRPGLSGLALQVLAMGTLALLGQAMTVGSWLDRTRIGLLSTITPRLQLADVLAGDAPWTSLVAWASSVSLALTLAIVVMNRKEIAYGAEP